jgi:hypothetical protein
MMLPVLENMHNTFLFGVKILCNGRVIVRHILEANMLIINDDFM